MAFYLLFGLIGGIIYIAKACYKPGDKQYILIMINGVIIGISMGIGILMMIALLVIGTYLRLISV